MTTMFQKWYRTKDGCSRILSSIAVTSEVDKKRQFKTVLM